MISNLAGDGPGAETAPVKDVTLREPLAVLIIDGKPWCPHCNADLSESGAVRVPLFEYVDLYLDEGKIRADYNLDFEASRGENAQCATCHGALAEKGAWLW